MASGSDSSSPSKIGHKGHQPSSVQSITPSQTDWDLIRKTILASSVSACLGKITTHPLDTIKAKLQVQVTLKEELTTRASLDRPALIRNMLANPRNLYQGFTVAVLGSLPAGALYMSTYEYVKPKLESHIPSTFLANFTGGLVAEAISCVFWCPVDIVKERLQVQDEMRAKGVYSYEGPADAVRQILRTDGIRGLYRAYGATLVAFGPQTAINLALYEKAERDTKQWYFSGLQSRSKDRPLPPYLNFVIACFSGCVSCLVTTPLDLAKLRMQVVRAQQHSENKVFAYKNVFDAMYQISRQEGVPALFKGALMRCVVWVPQTAIFLATFKSILQRLD